jgi:anti-sigma B factor antagonist
VTDRYDPNVTELEEPLTVEVTSTGDEVVLVVVGELDPHTAPTLRSRVEETVSDATTSLVLDVAGLQFIDSSGLRVIIAAHKVMDERGGRLVLRAPTANTRRLLEITGLADHVDLS